MSYDLVVFDPGAVARDAEAVRAWFEVQSAWGESHDYQHPQVTTPALRAWYDHMRATFPPLNGPDAARDDDLESIGDAITDYSIGRHLIYASFRWSRVDDAHLATRVFAGASGVAFYDISGDGEVWWPVPGGMLVEVT